MSEFGEIWDGPGDDYDDYEENEDANFDVEDYDEMQRDDNDGITTDDFDHWPGGREFPS